MLAATVQIDMYTSTGQRARDGVASVQVAQISVEAMAKAVMPEG